MKTCKKSKVLLAGAMLTALTGCGGDSAGDYTPPTPTNSAAPTHGGDIVLSFNEKDALTFVNLLGTPNGTATGEGVAADADGNYLSVTDISISTSGPRVDDILDAGIEINGNQIGVRPLAVAPNLDTGETHTAVVSFNISDGGNKTPRTATITFEGEDFAPVIANDLIANYTRDAGMNVVDGLLDVTDADGEVLNISNLMAAPDNPFELPVTINGSTIEVNVAAVESQIPDGQKVTFNFTYTVSDHRFDLERIFTVNVLGVQDIPGAPLVLNYFLTEDIQETDGMLIVDLAKEIEEREGDAIIISDLKLDGEAYINSFAGRLENNTFYFNPNAYFDEIAADAFRDFRFTMKVADDQGNMSDGERELSIRVNGVESNLLLANGMDVGFENGGTGFEATWCDPGAGLQSSIVANGDASFQMLGAPCYYAVTADVFPDLQAGGKYYFHYNAYVGNGDASPYIMLSADPNGSHNFWAGARPWHPANASWRPLLIEYDTASGFLATANGDGETPMDIAEQLRLFVMSAWNGNDGMPVVDDFTFARFDNLEGVDILTNSPGSFEDADFVPAATGGGMVEVREDPNDASNKVLYVDTTGATENVVLSFPIDNGAMVSGGRYRVTYEVQYLNYTENNDAGTDPNINQWGGYQFEVQFANPDIGLDFTLFSTIWNGADYGQVQNIADETSHWWGFGAETDWNSENNRVNFVLKGVGAQYIIDNIEIVRVP